MGTKLKKIDFFEFFNLKQLKTVKFVFKQSNSYSNGRI
jgi:hypothetical protein